MFYRRSDTIVLLASRVEMVDRCYRNVTARLSPNLLRVGEDRFKPEEVAHLEVVTSEIVVPREAMGLGDVKMMAMVGAFTGPSGVLFTLFAASIVGAAVGLARIPFRGGSLRGELPFGCSLAPAAMAALPYARRAIDAYLTLVGFGA